jgi:hypothetical protein
MIRFVDKRENRDVVQAKAHSASPKSKKITPHTNSSILYIISAIV